MINLNWLKNRYTLGISVGLNSVRAILIETVPSSVKPGESLCVEYPEALSSSSNFEALDAALKSVVQHYAYHFRRHYLPVQVAVADPLVSSALFELEKIPAKQAVRNDLLSMRFQKDYHVETQGSIIESQQVSMAERPGLYAVAVKKSLVDIIETTFRDLAPLHSIDKSIHYVFNYFYTQIQPGAAMLYLNDEYWTLIIWNESRVPVYIRSKQRAAAQAMNECVDDVQRLLHTCQQNEKTSFNRLYVIESGNDCGFTAALVAVSDLTIEPLSFEMAQCQLHVNDIACYAAVQL